MNKQRVCFYILSILFFQIASAQKEKDSLVLNLHLQFENAPLELNKNYISKNQDTLQISLLKFYISAIQIHYSDKTVFKQKNSFHLVTIDDLHSLQIPVQKNNHKSIDKVFFTIGIDSLTSVSGALSGDLDPTKGMYWAWQSGYINMKLEGKSSSCKTRKNEFQFHIGGYLQPFYAKREIELIPSSKNLDVIIDVAAFFSVIKLSEVNSIMIPGKKAMEIADNSVKMFKIE
jgi:hypothetical protein